MPAILVKRVCNKLRFTLDKCRGVECILTVGPWGRAASEGGGLRDIPKELGGLGGGPTAPNGLAYRPVERRMVGTWL